MATQPQINLSTELYRKFGTSISSDVQNNLDDINNSISTIQNNFLPLVGGNLNGDLTLSNHNISGINIIDATNAIIRNTLTLQTDTSFNQDDLQGQINFQGQYWSGSNTENGSSIKSFKATPDGNAGSYLTIHTVDTGNTLNEVIRVTEGGNVGIGINNPDTKLSINGDIKISRNILASVNTGLATFGYEQSTIAGVYGGFDGATIHGAYFQLFGKDSAGTGETPPGGGEFIINSTNGATKFTLGVYDGSNFATKFVVNSDGNVGIGNTSPTALLDIVGTSGNKQLLTIKPVTNPQSAEYLAVYDINNTELFIIGANGVVDIGALHSASISADQILIAGQSLGSAAFTDISAFDVAGAALFVQENSLPLSGGIMNQDASIAFQNGANIGQGTTDLGIGGAKGISLRCSVEYELNYQAGRLTNFEPDGITVRSLPLGSPLLFLPDTNINDYNNQGSIDPNSRILHNANGDVMLDWSGTSLTGIGIDSTVNTEVYTNSANWNDVVTIVSNNSAIQWNYQGADVQALSGNWQDTLTTVANNSAIWLLSGLSIETDPIFTSWARTNSGLFLGTYNTVQSNSSVQWNYQGTDIKTLTGVWQNSYTKFSSQSANNLSVFSNVNSNSAINWNYQGTDIKALTGNWQSGFTTYSTHSAVYVSTTDTGTVSNNMLVNNNINIANSAISLGGSISTSNILDGITNIQGSTLYRSVSGWTMLRPGTNGQFLQTGGVSANPSWQSVASGITVGTTTTNGASANDIIISDGSLVQKLTPGTGVSTALTNAVNITGGLLTYGIIGVSGTKVPLLNTANTFTTTQNFSSGIITSSTPAISITQTWNNSAVSFVGMKIAAICTSNAASDLLSVYGGVAGTSVGLRVTNAAGSMGVQVPSIFDSSSQWSLNYFVNGLAMGSSKNIYWSSTVNYYDTGDIGFSRAGVGILKLSNIGTPTLPTSWQVINTYTSTTNYEAGVMDWQTTSNTLRIGSAVGSVSGIARDVSIIHGGAEKIHISAGGTAIGSAGTSHSLIKSGVVTLVAGVATVSDSNVKNTGTALTNSRIIINRMDDGGTPGDSYSITRINGTSFTITSKSAGATQVLDTSTVSWLMINP